MQPIKGAPQSSLEPSSASPSSIRVRLIGFSELDARMIGAWADLEQRTIEPNAYLSPSFVLPSIRHFRPQAEPLVCVLETETPGTHELVGLAVFQAVRGSRWFPLPHLRAYRSPHAYLGGLLFDRSRAAAAAEALFAWLRSRRSRWHGVDVHVQIVDESGDNALTRAIVAGGATWHPRWRAQRAVLIPAKAGEAYLGTRLTVKRAQDLRRYWRRLEEQGPVRWRALGGPEVDSACIERFIDLEHRGWKGQEGTSLRTRPEDEDFFREMIEGFAARGCALFTELSVGDTVVASTSNLISGKRGFAFKIGWHPDYRRMAPGLVNEVEFIRHAPMLVRDLDFIDSGTSEGSFIDELWSEQRVVVSGAYAATPVARKLLQAIDAARRLKRWGLGLVRQSSPKDKPPL